MEGEIGRFRRRHLTPVPHVGSLAALSKALAAADARDDTAGSAPGSRPSARPPPTQLSVGCPGGVGAAAADAALGRVPRRLGREGCRRTSAAFPCLSYARVVRNAEADAGDVLVGVDMTAKTLIIQVKDNGVGIDPHVTPGGRNPAARTRASGGHATVVRRSSRGPPSPGWHSRLRESGSRSPSCRGETLQSAPTFQRGGHGRTDFGPDPVDRWPLIRPNPPLPQ